MKSMIAALLLLGSVSAFADQFQLVPGKEILVDAGKQDIISLLLKTNSKTKALPKLTLVKQWSNFECEHVNTIKKSNNTWEFQLTWKPGADLSGCIVSVSYPGQEDARAEIFMNY